MFKAIEYLSGLFSCCLDDGPEAMADSVNQDAARIDRLESECDALAHKCHEKKSIIEDLKDRLNAQEARFQKLILDLKSENDRLETALAATKTRATFRGVALSIVTIALLAVNFILALAWIE